MIDLGPFPDLHAADRGDPLGGEFACPVVRRGALWMDSRQPPASLRQVNEMPLLTAALQSTCITPAFNPAQPFRGNTVPNISSAPRPVALGQRMGRDAEARQGPRQDPDALLAAFARGSLSLGLQELGREVFQARTLAGQESCANRPLNVTPTTCVSPRADQIDHPLDGTLNSRATEDSTCQRSSINHSDISEAIEYFQEIRGGHKNGSTESHHSGIFPVIGLCRTTEDL